MGDYRLMGDCASWAISPPLEELVKEAVAGAVGCGLAVVQKSLEFVGRDRGRRRRAAAMSVEPFLRGRKPIPIRDLGGEVDLLPFGMSGRLLELAELREEDVHEV